MAQLEAKCSWPRVLTEQGEQILAYGAYWPVMSDIALELLCFRLGWGIEQGGRGKYGHLYWAHRLVWPELTRTYHEWTEDRLKAFCEGWKVITLAGGASSAKSADAARYALLWWWALPDQRAVIVCSTTIGSLMKRIWSYITEYLYMAEGMPGHVSNSPPPKILYNRRDAKHGIHGFAVKEGNVARTLADIIGIHPKQGLLLIVDEMSDVTPAILDAQTNLDSGKVEFQLIGLANSKSRLDPHGKASTPKKGWNSVNPDRDKRWETNLGLCLYFDCYQSPAIRHPNDPDLTFLPTAEKIRREAERLGVNHPQFWRFVRGFWPPEDLTKTVLTLSMIEAHGARLSTRWAGTWKIKIAALDPAYVSGGDECILRFADVGQDVDGKFVIDAGGEENIVPLPIDSRSREPMTYQIVKLARAECEKRGVEPKHFGMDVWGFGAGAADVLEKNWSDEIIRIAGVGAPSDLFVDVEQTKKAYEVFDRRITELWFMVREFCEADQLRGLDDATCEEFCSREYSDEKRKYSLETKEDYKKRMGKGDGPTGSPDRGDALALLIEVARTAFGLLPGRKNVTLDERQEWQSRYEEMRFGAGGRDQEEYEASWDADAILDSMAFEEAYGD